MDVRHWMVVIGLLALSACGTVGSGDLSADERSVGSFNSLEVGDGINVDLTIDPAAASSVTVNYDDNLLDQVVTEVRGETLVIEFEGMVTILGGDRSVDVVVDSLERIEVSGGSDLQGSGTVDRYELRASGGSDVDLGDLEARSVEIDVSGGSDVRVYASESIEGEASGGSDVLVLGDPDRSRVDTSGGSDVDFDN